MYEKCLIFYFREVPDFGRQNLELWETASIVKQLGLGLVQEVFFLFLGLWQHQHAGSRVGNQLDSVERVDFDPQSQIL